MIAGRRSAGRRIGAALRALLPGSWRPAAGPLSEEAAPGVWFAYAEGVARRLQAAFDGEDAAACRLRAHVGRWADRLADTGDDVPVLPVRAWLDRRGHVTRIDSAPASDPAVHHERMTRASHDGRRARIKSNREGNRIMMKKMNLLAMVAASLVLGTPLVARAQDDVIANAAQASVTQADIAGLLKAVSPEGRERLAADPAALDQVVRSTLAQKAVLAEAKSKGWDKQAQVQQAIEQAQRDIVARSYLASVSAPPADYPSDAEIQSTYDRNRAAFTAPRALHVAQIYLAVPPNADAATVDKARKQAADLANRARGGDFAALAKANSQDKASAANGGDLGYVPDALMLPAVRQAADALKPGQVSAPVQTPTGFHVVKLIDVRAAAPRPLADVKDQVRATLRAQRTQQNAQAYLAKLAANAPINEDALKKALASAR
ncbi:peptidyl-prolyl cis-trans isomerase [Burkholderia anthina]|uniref:Peptidyl-prolyl cis-trans isomerase n=2 Tax=Burkholderia anthina TaxID=179879 RepID=A0A6P2G656_9BURK|nr:peptidylprolyl isomerase [Burkholderia anthina]VVU49047.1 peptidyl-prolyl cis-trans isomerase [Burkholderia anthina]